MKNVDDCLDVQKTFDLVLKEIYSIYKTKKLTKEQIKKYKMSEREIFEKNDDLSENELNTNNNKEVYAKNDVMATAEVKKEEVREKQIDLEKN